MEKLAAKHFIFDLDPLRTLERCLNSSTNIEYKSIIPIEAKYHFFECNCCRKDKVQGWVYIDEVDGEWKPFTVLHRCTDCFNNRKSQVIFKEIEQQRNNALMDRYWFLEPNLFEAGFKNFFTENEISSNAKTDVIDYVRNILDGTPDPLNIVLVGTFGSGKSHLATAAARTLKSKGKCVGYIQEENYLEIIKGTFNDPTQSEKKILDDMKRFDVLVFDELGSENFKMESTSWISTRLLHLLNARKGKPTIFTTNLSTKMLPNAIGERAYSRLKVGTKFIDMYSEADYRDNFLH